ncbi:hypothetical protein EDD11_003264 [Mortierella claussenii]|nr:hypothetical protein EDD11_003264 [Mortierella claussenii]
MPRLKCRKCKVKKDEDEDFYLFRRSMMPIRIVMFTIPTASAAEQLSVQGNNCGSVARAGEGYCWRHGASHDGAAERHKADKSQKKSEKSVKRELTEEEIEEEQKRSAWAYARFIGGSRATPEAHEERYKNALDVFTGKYEKPKHGKNKKSKRAKNRRSKKAVAPDDGESFAEKVSCEEEPAAPKRRSKKVSRTTEYVVDSEEETAE